MFMFGWMLLLLQFYGTHAENNQVTLADQLVPTWQYYLQTCEYCTPPRKVLVRINSVSQRVEDLTPRDMLLSKCTPIIKESDSVQTVYCTPYTTLYGHYFAYDVPTNRWSEITITIRLPHFTELFQAEDGPLGEWQDSVLRQACASLATKWHVEIAEYRGWLVSLGIALGMSHLPRPVIYSLFVVMYGMFAYAFCRD